ncbi:uncharacterized protein LOC132904156 [Amyelois transitella]|uniref:uncharacterized protein LOC132904156 n=1 Tax=Amyelois transitella TaxID=680683 RepID=UPI00298FC6DC|nr:uncharacterized protein LOC132904156 [Amyelois transitella]
MDTQLANNLEDLQKMFLSRMELYDQKLAKASVGGPAVHKDLASLSREYSEFKTFIWQAFSKIKSQLELLTTGQDRHEMAMRRKVLLLHGLSEKQNEKLHDEVHRIICSQMNLSDVPSNSLQVCHRLGTASSSKHRPVLVRFTTLEHRSHVWDNKTSLKGTGITISEFLTRPRHRAFTMARNHFGVKNCWSSEGKIVVLLPDKTRSKVETVAEVTRLISIHPVCSDIPGPSGTQESAPKRQTRQKSRHR